MKSREAVAVASKWSGARILCAYRIPAALVTALKMPDGSGLDPICETRRSFPAMEIMVVSVPGTSVG